MRAAVKTLPGTQASFVVPCSQAFRIGLHLVWMGFIGAILRRRGVDFEIGTDG